MGLERTRTAVKRAARQAKREKRWGFLKSYFKFSHLPGIIPRLRDFGDKLSHFAALLAQIYGAVGLIPPSHPVLNPVHAGKFGFRDVIAAASSNLVLSWRNIDQILVFIAIIMGLLILLVQTFLIVFSVAIGTAFASAGTGPASFFTTPNPETDVALIFLEQVFGDIDIFSDASFGAPGANSANPVFQGLYSMLSFYSMAMMVFAAIIVVYYVITVLAEAAQTGTPFGRRFNSVWAPIRLVVALGLLVPLGNGLNSAQYITLYAAKMGSGFATNAWSIFATEMTRSPQTLIVETQAPGMADTVKGIYLAEVCRAANNEIEGNLGGTGDVEVFARRYAPRLERQVARSGQRFGDVPFTDMGPIYDSAIAANVSSVSLRWALVDSNGRAGAQNDACGRLSHDIAALDLTDFLDFGGDSEDKMRIIQEVDRNIAIEIGSIVNRIRSRGTQLIPVIAYAENGSDLGAAEREAYAESNLPRIAEDLNEIIREVDAAISEHVSAGYRQLTAQSSPNYDRMIERGWASAGLWYTQIGKINEMYLSVTSGIPSVGFPVNSGDSDADRSDGGLEQVTLFRWAGDILYGTTEKRRQMATVLTQVRNNHLNDVFVPIPVGGVEAVEVAEDGAGGGFNTLLVAIFQLEALQEMRENAGLNPMVAMQTAGHDILFSSFIAIGAYVGTAIISGVLSAFQLDGWASVVSGLGGMALAFALIGLAAGFVLFYLLPIIPFMYFFFAVVGWVLEIFEAIVAMPLWALGHLRIDGDGYFGPGALQGYLLIFAILTRPLFIVFGLIGGYVVFGAAVYLLSEVYGELIDIIGTSEFLGFSYFAYTIIFTYIVYQLAFMCFKMVDSVPNQIMRWMGQSVQTFNDNRGDPIGQTTGAIIAGAAVANQLQQGLSSAGQGFKGAITARQQKQTDEQRKRDKRAQLRAMGADPDDPNLYR